MTPDIGGVRLDNKLRLARNERENAINWALEVAEQVVMCEAKNRPFYIAKLSSALDRARMNMDNVRCLERL
jgi:hypothetical protein